MLHEVVCRKVFGTLKNISSDCLRAMLTPLPGKGRRWKYPKWFYLFVSGDQSLNAVLNKICKKTLELLSDNQPHHIHRGSGIGQGTLTACYELGWIKHDLGVEPCDYDCCGVFGITELGQAILKSKKLDFTS